MTTATAHRRAHLETVIEFELDPVPESTPPRALGERALRARRVLGGAGLALGIAAAGAIGTSIGTRPAPLHVAPPASQVHAPAGAPCRPVAVTPSRHDEPHMRCTVPVPVTPSAEVAMRAARDAAIAAARARAQAHGPGTGTHRRWAPTDAPPDSSP